MAKTRYVWSSVSDSVLQEKDGNTGVTQVTYTNEPVAYGPLRSERRGTETRQYHFDALGSTRAMTDDSQTVTDTFTYDAFGEPLAGSDNSTPYRWNGRWGYRLSIESAELVGINYTVRHRRYRPQLSRWVSADPISLADYLYGLNAPTQWIDPSGLYCAPCQDVGVIRTKCDSVGGGLKFDGLQNGPLPLQPPLRGRWWAQFDGKVDWSFTRCDECCVVGEQPKNNWLHLGVKGVVNIEAGVHVIVGGMMVAEPSPNVVIGIAAIASATAIARAKLNLNGEATFSPCKDDPCAMEVCTEAKLNARLRLDAHAFFITPIFEAAASSRLRGGIEVSPLEVCWVLEKCQPPGHFELRKKPGITDLWLELEACARLPIQGRRCFVWRII